MFSMSLLNNVGLLEHEKYTLTRTIHLVTLSDIILVKTIFEVGKTHTIENIKFSHTRFILMQK